jgi:hypothetical protein
MTKRAHATTKKMKRIAAPDLRASDPVVLELWTKAAGRCEFHGCNEYLLEDKLTTNKAKLADIAHIVARSRSGPRGDDPMPLSERNHIENLMLACTTHHRMIDNKRLVAQYPKTLLMQYKADHEARIRHLTEMKPEHETVVLRVLGNIRGDSVSVSHDEVRTAVLGAKRYPRYLQSDNTIEIDLQGLTQTVNAEYWTAAKASVDDTVTRLISPNIGNSIKHLSVFALARIPILVYLGNAIGDKVITDFYQRHRDEPIGWSWRQGDPINFEAQRIQNGTDKKCVALVLSLSGKIARESRPSHIDGQYHLYEIAPVGAEPGRSIFNTRESLAAFQRTYQSALRAIEAEHGLKGDLHLFTAIPAPVAVICGRELMKDVSPRLHVYDRMEDGYELALTIN